MEWLINLVIIFIVFLAIFKRIQEVAKKGGEIMGPPGSPPVPSREAAEEFRTVEQPVEEEIILHREEMQPKREPSLSIEDIFEKLRGGYVQPEVQPEPEITPEEELPPEVEQVVPAPAEPFVDMKITPLRKTPGFALQFTGPDLVRGILMREILGPPLSLREYL